MDEVIIDRITAIIQATGKIGDEAVRILSEVAKKLGGIERPPELNMFIADKSIDVMLWLTGKPRSVCDDLFLQAFPNGHPSVLTDYDVRAFICAAVEFRRNANR